MAMKLIGQSIKLALWIAAAFAIWHIVSTLVRPVEVVHYDFGLGRKKLKQIPADLSQISEDEIGKRVNLAWDRIEAKLKTLAPRYLDSLLPGASEESIQDVEEILGFRLMADYRASLLRHNGTDGSWLIFDFLPVEELQQKRYDGAVFAFETQSLDYYDLDHSSGMWEPGVLTIGDSHFDLLLECETGETLIQNSVNYSASHHDSFLDFLEHIADRLEGNFGYYSDGKGKNRTLWLDDFGR